MPGKLFIFSLSASTFKSSKEKVALYRILEPSIMVFPILISPHWRLPRWRIKSDGFSVNPKLAWFLSPCGCAIHWSDKYCFLIFNKILNVEFYQ